MSRPTVVCLTPIKDEDWILQRFLSCASMWADIIIVADQGSEDRSREIASSYEKVRLIRNECADFNEPERQKLLIDAAREMVPEQRLLIALDADEVLSGNFIRSDEWQRILNAEPGTNITFHWANLKPGCQQFWRSRGASNWGFMDDGTEHRGNPIHSPRVPINEGGPVIACEDLHVLHYQYADPERVASKHRWYQCFERLREPDASPLALFDQYHHMYAVSGEDLRDVPHEWFDTYVAQSINMTSINQPPNGVYRWDALVVDMFRDHGLERFARECIWSDWPRLARRMHAPNEMVRDPRTMKQKLVHRMLQATNKTKKGVAGRLLRSYLKRNGW